MLSGDVSCIYDLDTLRDWPLCTGWNVSVSERVMLYSSTGRICWTKNWSKTERLCCVFPHSCKRNMWKCWSLNRTYTSLCYNTTWPCDFIQLLFSNELLSVLSSQWGRNSVVNMSEHVGRRHTCVMHVYICPRGFCFVAMLKICLCVGALSLTIKGHRITK